MRTVGLSIVAALIAALATSAVAQVTCGTTVGGGEKLTLSADVGPCDNDDSTAITVDSGMLDLGGHTVSCADLDVDLDLPQGVVLLGKKARVVNGTITGCSNGVGVGGSGKHRVEGLTITGSADDGIDVLSDSVKNKVIGNTVRQSGSDGIYIRSDKNKLVDNTASENLGDGIELEGGADKNKLVGNQAGQNGNNGIEVNGSKNKLTECTANQNVANGIDLGGEKNKVRGGSAQGNGVYDIVPGELGEEARLRHGVIGMPVRPNQGGAVHPLACG